MFVTTPPASFGATITAAIIGQLNPQPVGAAVGIVRDGQIIYIKGFGLRDKAADKPVDADTRFEIGSVTKQFTAAAILQLKEQGKLTLDDRIAKYLPSFPHANEITLRQLLNQVSGLEDYLAAPDAQARVTSVPGSLEQVAEAAKAPLHFVPGSRWEYSNTNYYVLGKIVEIVSGQTYDRYIREHLFAPAGMSHSGFVGSERNLTDVATGYWEGPGQKGPAEPAPPILESWAGGAGAIVSTIGDLAAWDTALASGKIVNADDVALMSTPGRLNDGRPTAYGMGLGLDIFDGHKRVWHNGGSYGTLTMDATYPDDRIDIIVFENDLDGDPRAIEGAIFDVLFPRAAVAENDPAPGEDLAARPKVMHFIDETLKGTVATSEMAPGFAKIATPQMQAMIARRLAALGPMTTVIFKGKDVRPDATTYSYRLLFGSRPVMVRVTIDKATGILDGIGIGP